MLSDSVDRNGFSPFSTRLMRVKHVLVPSMFVVPCDNTDVIIYTQLIYENIIDKRNVLELYLFNDHVSRQPRLSSLRFIDKEHYQSEFLSIQSCLQFKLGFLL